MFDVSLLELLIIFIVSMLVLKPEDAISIFTKFENFSNNPIKQDFLDFKEIDTIEEKENAFCFKDGNRKKDKLKKFTLAEHLSELKSRLIQVLLFFIVTTLITFQFSWDIFAILSKPLINLTKDDAGFHFIYTKLTEGFMTELKIAFIFSLFFTSPVFFYHLYKFLAPGLYRYEKNVIAPYLLFPPILFLTGVFTVYFVVMPVTWKFFISFQNLTPENGVMIRLEAKVSEYVDLIIELFTGFGVAFQLPILLIMLTKLKIITASQLIKFRRYSIVSIFIVAAILTPPDVFSQIVLALPLMLLYEISIFCCKRVKSE